MVLRLASKGFALVVFFHALVGLLCRAAERFALTFQVPDFTFDTHMFN